MQRHLDHDLAGLRDKLLTMASHAELTVTQAIKALVDRDDRLAQQVQDADTTLDHYEMELDELCLKLLALKAPLASDLRLITVAMKITQNLERVGDEATKIAKRVLDLNREPPLKPYRDIPRMAVLATEMLKTALDAFVKGDAGLARELIRRDAEVDALNKQVQSELAGFMVENPQNITRCLHLMVISKSLERIADHATNVAEEVVFLLEGHDIRHSKKTALSSPPASAPAS
jgi:phosphate transport system protein